MKQLSNLKTNIEKLLSENDIEEDIDIRISNVVNYDFQINNLVKYQSNPNIQKIVDSISKVIEKEKEILNG